MKKLYLHPLFLFGLVVRLVLVIATSPMPVTQWYVPFLEASISSFSLDPWAVWLGLGGDSAAFPYGYVMWLCFLPMTLLCKMIGLPLIYGYGSTLIAADFALMLLLRRMNPGRDRLILATYWLSPIVIVASYLLGFNDLIPVLFLALSLYFVRHHRLAFSGLACMAAISAKLSMVLAFPFFLIYLLHNRALRQYFQSFIKGFMIGAVFLELPFLFSESGLHMLFSNPEMAKVYRLALNLGGNTQIYLVPLAYLLMLYAAWRVRRLNFELFHALFGMAFLLVVLMTPASPGWFIWSIPLLITYQATSGRIAIVLTAIFSVLYVLSSLLLSPFVLTVFRHLPSLSSYHFPAPTGSDAASLLHTAMVATGIILAIRIWRETVSRNDYFRLSRKPFVIGVAGDSKMPFPMPSRACSVAMLSPRCQVTITTFGTDKSRCGK